MSSIWHKPDEAPRYRFQCVYYHRDSKEYYFGEYDPTFRVFLGKKTFGQLEVWKFAFAEDIMSCLDELERTREALKIAIDAIDMGEAALIGCQEADDKYISDITAEDGLELLGKALGKIRVLQKDVK